MSNPVEPKPPGILSQLDESGTMSAVPYAFRQRLPCDRRSVLTASNVKAAIDSQCNLADESYKQKHVQRWQLYLDTRWGRHLASVSAHVTAERERLHDCLTALSDFLPSSTVEQAAPRQVFSQ